MIPVQLILQGLYSYQEKQTIDFTRLTTSNLFGIFGAVGCGKSSILEAITYALYGRTSRLNLSGDNRYYNMMNLKSDKLLIDFIFETGKDQTAYRSVVKGKRNKNNFEEVNALNRSTYKKIDDEWVPVDAAELEQAIGLSYDNFRRTIIIPQGQFQEFLQLGNRDRTQMMKELFDLGKYEFYNKVASLESKNNALKQNLEGQIHALEGVDEAQAEAYRQQINLLKKEVEELEVKIKQYQQQADELKQLKELSVKLTDSEQQLNRLQEQEPEYKKLEKNIARYEQCVVQFKHLVSSFDECVVNIGKKEKLIQQEEKNLDALKAAISEAGKQLEEIKPAYSKRDELIKRAEDLGLLIQVKEFQATISSNQDRLTKGMSVLEATGNKINELKQKKADLDSLIKSGRQNLPDMSVLADVRAWHVANDGLENQSKETDSQIDKYNRESDALNQKLHAVLADPVFTGLQDKSNLAVVHLHIAQLNESVKRQLESLQLEVNELGVKAQLQKYAGELKEGRACPLCGSFNHPQIYTAEDLHESHNRIKALQNKSEQELDKNNDLKIQLNDLQNRINFNAGNLNEWKKKKTELAGKIKEHQALFIWNKYRSKGELNEAFVEAEKIQTFIKEKEKELGVAVTSLDKEVENVETYRTELEKIKDKVTISKTRAATLKEQIKVVVPADYEQVTPDEISGEKERLQESFRRLEEQYEKLNRQLEEHRNNASNITGALDAQRKELNQEKEKLQMLSARLDEQLEKAGYNEVDEVRRILVQPVDVEQEKEKLAEFRKQQALLSERVRQLQTEINNRNYEPETHEKLTAEMDAAREQSQEKNQAVGNITGLLKKLQFDLEQKAKLAEEHQKLELRAENIKTMKSLFTASGFVNYISSVYLQNLCNAANERFFQLTRQRLSLEITSDNNFQVRDFMNGGKVRSVKTLSGGQTFQAALSLALALADNIQKITESNQNFFFLDEGFGSLDKESLAVVFDTLKTLRKENRIVGVISHVEEMQQEIDVHLQINHHEERGSIVRPSWTGGAGGAISESRI